MLPVSETPNLGVFSSKTLGAYRKKCGFLRLVCFLKADSPVSKRYTFHSLRYIVGKTSISCIICIWGNNQWGFSGFLSLFTITLVVVNTIDGIGLLIIFSDVNAVGFGLQSLEEAAINSCKFVLQSFNWKGLLLRLSHVRSVFYCSKQ